MKTSRHDPLRLDVAAFAADGAVLSGQWPGHTLTRLAELQVPPQDGPLADVSWRASGERRAVPASESELWLTLQVNTPVWLTCQRCLQPMPCALALDQRLRFVAGEAQAEALDADSDDDVLALSRSLDLRELAEDELLLALPLVPRHDECPQPLPVAIGLESDEGEPSAAGDEPHGVGSDPSASEARPNPFAVLRSLRKSEAPD